MVSVTSLTRSAFNSLLVEFKKYYKCEVNPKGERPWKFSDASTVLGLLLTFYCDSMSIKSLCRLFGAPPKTVERTILRAEDALLLALRGDPSGPLQMANIRSAA